MKKTIIIHPYLFAIFPIISFYNHNKDLTRLSYILYPLIISLLFTIILFFILKRLVKNNIKSAIISSIFVTLFFSFGHFLSIAPRFYIILWKLTITTDLFLIVLWINIIVLIALLILKTKKNLLSLNGYLNIVAIFLIFLPLINIGIYEYNSKKILESLKAENHSFIINSNEELPDIYYIIFDGYAREDVLKEIYQHDNSDFINYLTNKGFYVAHQSRTNYPQTYLSIASSLNFEYINYISKIVGEESGERRPLAKMIMENNVYKILKNKGYLFVSVHGGWTGVILYSDIHIHAEKVALNDFENALINTTPLGIFFVKKYLLNLHRKKILYGFNHIPDIAEIDHPTFVYMHFMIPHPPFVFDKDGKLLKPKGIINGKDGSHYFEINPSKEEYRKKYKNQIVFLNKKAKEMIDEILSRSNRPPIIILQSDHGPGSMTYWEDPGKTDMKERLSILNAYYLPEEGKELLYQTITPVNSFRVIFNHIFNTDFELLNDKSYFATWNHPYKFINVTEELIDD